MMRVLFIDYKCFQFINKCADAYDILEFIGEGVPQQTTFISNRSLSQDASVNFIVKAVFGTCIVGVKHVILGEIAKENAGQFFLMMYKIMYKF